MYNSSTELRQLEVVQPFVYVVPCFVLCFMDSCCVLPGPVRHSTCYVSLYMDYGMFENIYACFTSNGSTSLTPICHLLYTHLSSEDTPIQITYR